ncbi:MAG: BlaI/MecI/CopY family transcriptional regulator [Pseudomonadota bacterium]
MARPSSPTLTEAESRIMAILWERGEATVREVTDALSAKHDLAYTTVLTTIRIMSDKGYVDFRKEGRAHVYRPALSRTGARKRALGSVLSSLFEGSPRRLAQHLIEDDSLTLEDIEALRKDLLERQKKGEGRG